MALLFDISASHKVDICWVKGHDKTTGNEYADMLAKVGMEEAARLSYQSPFLPASPLQVKKTLRRDFYLRWQNRWENDNTCWVSHLFRPQVRERKDLSHMSFQELSKLSQIITGHGLFKRHLRHWNDIGDIQCALCGEDDEFSWHLWEYCPNLSVERDRMRNLVTQGLSSERAMLKFFDLTPLMELTAQNEALIGTNPPGVGNTAYL